MIREVLAEARRQGAWVVAGDLAAFVGMLAAIFIVLFTLTP